MRSVSSQRGLAAAAIIVVLIVVAVTMMFGRRYFGFNVGLDQREQTETNFKRATEALAGYAALNHRLPCPAAGNSDAGTEDAVSPYSTCSSPDGVVPWSTIGLKREYALDGWGRKLSYRVFSGDRGLTQTGGASMINCNTSLGAPINSLDSGTYFLCKPAVGAPPSGTPPPNTPAQFMAEAGRANMLVVQDQGATRNGNAFVIISHGETGYGAFVAEGASARTQSPSNAKELLNIGAGGEYWIEAHSAPGVSPEAIGHFDDVVSYMSFTELVARTKLGARSWSLYPLSATFSSANVTAAVTAAGGTMSGENTGQTSLSMGGFLITGRSSSGASNIAIRTENGITGIGTIGGGSTAGDLNSAFNETLTFQLGDGSEFGKADVALNAFEVTDYFPLQKERAEISLWRAGEPLQTSTIESWDAASNPSRCLYRLVTGGKFDRMDVRPLSQTGGGGSSRFTVTAIKACTDATTPCATTVAGAVACPIPAPSSVPAAATGIGTTTATLNGTVEDNGIAKGTGTGYRTASSFFGYSAGTSSIPLTAGSGTILEGNCFTISSDANTYVVASGISAPGTIVLAPPGLRVAIPAFTTRNVTLAHCPTTMTYDYGPTCSFSSGTVAATPSSINAGSGSTSVSASIAGLACGTVYYFRLNATSQGSVTTSGAKMLRTSACAYATPGAETSVPIEVTTTTANLVGFVTDNGATATVTFEYGPTSCYGSSVAATPGTVASGAGMTAASAMVGDPLHPTTPTPALACNTWYHYRTVATSATGTTKGDDVAFRTAACP